jgi:sigma-54-specific transcriptional regulator
MMEASFRFQEELVCPHDQPFASLAMNTLHKATDFDTESTLIDNSAKLLTLPVAGGCAPTIRAKALVFSDPFSKRILRQIELVGPSSATVLIVGETGTGKELVARHLHELSGREGPFVAINCGAFNENFVEAELFGHESGAFTGAQQARAGWFEAANGGTLFLDEIGDMPLQLQVKLLRVLQERQVVRLGSRKPISVDVRLIAATNVDLERAVLAGHFRRDLFYRLNVAPINLPNLSARPGDIPPLVNYFLDLYCRKLGQQEATLSDKALQSLLAYEWPGNIRELENVIHYALIVCRNDVIEEEDLRFSTLGREAPQSGGTSQALSTNPVEALQGVLGRLLDSDVENVFETVEQALVVTAFEHSGRNQVRAARRLGISRNILRAQLKRFGLLGE